MELFKLVGSIVLNGVDKSKKQIQEISFLSNTTAKNLQDTGSKISEVGTKVSSAGKKITTGMVAVGAAVTGAGAAVYAFANKAAATGDNVDKMSQKIGISREAYQELDFICSQSGTSVDTLQQGIKTLTTQMQSASDGTKSAVDIFGKLGISITDASGNLRSQEEVMWEAMSALQGMENQTEKAAIANDLFGRSGSELMPLLNGEAGSIEAMKKQAHELGLVLSDEAIDSSVKFTDTLDQMKRSLSVVGTELGVALMPYIQEFAEYVIAHLPQIREAASKVAEGFGRIATAIGNVISWYKNLTPEMQKTIGVIALVVAAIGPVLTILGGIISGIGTLVTIIPLITSPIGLVVAAIAALIAIIVLCVKHWDEIKAKAIEVANGISAKIEELVEKLGDLWAIIKTRALSIWESIRSGIREKAESIRTGVQEKFQNMKENIEEKLTSAKEKAVSIFTSIKDEIQSKIEDARDKVGEAIEKIKSFFDFEWKLPDIKLPHFKKTGETSLGLPIIGVEWYAKGGVLNQPTIFGMNPATGSAMVGGEAGAEAVAPIDVLQGYVAEAVASQNLGMVTVLERILDAILAMDENMGGNLREALDGTSLSINNREFGRLVRSVV